jgi:hypothetical protein
MHVLRHNVWRNKWTGSAAIHFKPIHSIHRFVPQGCRTLAREWASVLTPRGHEEGIVSEVVDTVVQAVYTLDNVDRVHVGGSWGKRTAVRGAFDVDLVAFVNWDPDEDHWNVTEFHNMVIRCRGLSDAGVHEFLPSRNALQFAINDLDVDLLVACNRSGRFGNCGACWDRDQAGEQRAALEEDVLDLDYYAASSSACNAGLAESVTDLLRELPGQVRRCLADDTPATKW